MTGDFHVQDLVVKLDLCIKLFEMNKTLGISLTLLMVDLSI